MTGMTGPAAVRPTKLFIGGISRQTTTKLLRDHFADYGQVLDCVAMRQPDGRSRGFGLVTLDSLAAAKRCLAEPMVIDGRVVDMKIAVPEKGYNAKASRGASEWSAPMDESHQYGFSASVAPVVQPASKVVMSADTPAFVPASAIKKATPAVKAEAVREVADEALLVFAEDYVCFLEQQQRMCSVKKAMAKIAPDFVAPKPPPGYAALPTPHGPPPAEPPPAPPATEVAAKKSEAVEDDADVEGDAAAGPLPSAGSKLHASGECRPCNFFPKGRCSSALECSFCHLSHEKRKPTRQEKRERQAAWQERQLNQATEGTEGTHEKTVDVGVADLLAAVPTQKLSRREKREQTKHQSDDAAVGPPGLAGSPALMAAANGAEIQCHNVQTVNRGPSAMAATLASLSTAEYPVRMPASQMPALALNFADYGDDSDSDSDCDWEVIQKVAAAAAAAGCEEASPGQQWSRNEMLRMKNCSGERCAEAPRFRTAPVSQVA